MHLLALRFPEKKVSKCAPENLQTETSELIQNKKRSFTYYRELFKTNVMSKPLKTYLLKIMENKAEFADLRANIIETFKMMKLED